MSLFSNYCDTVQFPLYVFKHFLNFEALDKHLEYFVSGPYIRFYLKKDGVTSK